MWLYEARISCDVNSGSLDLMFASQFGHLATAKWLHSLHVINVHFYEDEAFRLACHNGHLQVAQWLVGLGGVDIYARHDNAFQSACSNGYTRLAQWLLALGGDAHDFNSGLSHALSSGRRDLAMWLTDLGASPAVCPIAINPHTY
jgi:hypothetical protein